MEKEPRGLGPRCRKGRAPVRVNSSSLNDNRDLGAAEKFRVPQGEGSSLQAPAEAVGYRGHQLSGSWWTPGHAGLKLRGESWTRDTKLGAFKQRGDQGALRKGIGHGRKRQEGQGRGAGPQRTGETRKGRPRKEKFSRGRSSQQGAQAPQTKEVRVVPGTQEAVREGAVSRGREDTESQQGADSYFQKLAFESKLRFWYVEGQV